MRVYLGSDHAGFELKAHLVAHLTSLGHEAIDVGPAHYDADDDYPPFCIEAASRVLADPGSLGIVIGGSGNGEQIAANKVVGARAALAYDESTATLARQHNDANVVSLSGRFVPVQVNEQIVDEFLGTEFEGGRHGRRLDKIGSAERD